jgi:ArsR family transcriptional regulator
MKQVLPVLEALSDPVRLKLVSFIANKEEVTYAEAMEFIKLSQPATSHHCKILKQANILQGRKEGTRIFYSLNKERLLECGIDPKRIAKINTG